MASLALDEAKASGLTVIRTWFYQDDPTNPTKLQPQPGAIVEICFRLRPSEGCMSNAALKSPYFKTDMNMGANDSD